MKHDKSDYSLIDPTAVHVWSEWSASPSLKILRRSVDDEIGVLQQKWYRSGFNKLGHLVEDQEEWRDIPQELSWQTKT